MYACDLPGRWIADLGISLHCIVGPLILVQAFRSIRLNRHPIHDSEALECITLPLDRRRGTVCGGARTAGLGEADRPGILPIYGMCSPEIKTHPKLVELVRIK